MSSGSPPPSPSAAAIDESFLPNAAGPAPHRHRDRPRPCTSILISTSCCARRHGIKSRFLGITQMAPRYNLLLRDRFSLDHLQIERRQIPDLNSMATRSRAERYHKAKAVPFPAPATIMLTIHSEAAAISTLLPPTLQVAGESFHEAWPPGHFERAIKPASSPQLQFLTI